MIQLVYFFDQCGGRRRFIGFNKNYGSLTYSGKKIIREKLVKPSTKVMKMHWQSTSRGWGITVDLIRVVCFKQMSQLKSKIILF